MRYRSSLGWLRLGLLSLTLMAGTTMFQASPRADGEGLCDICGCDGDGLKCCSQGAAICYWP